MPAIRAVLFDLDGVLIDAKEWHYEALNRALRMFGMEISRYDHLVTYDGLPTKRKLEMLSLERGLPRGLHKFISEMKQQFTVEMIHTSCKPRFNHEHALSKLRREGYILAVCSNAVKESVELMLHKAGLSSFVDLVLSNEDVTRCKPDPEIYQSAFAKLKLKPEECLIVEDNHNGIRAALASGGHLLQVTYVEEVTYTNIKRRIEEIESGKKASELELEKIVIPLERVSSEPPQVKKPSKSEVLA